MAQETGTTAYFVVDAFRFEMGEELYRQLVRHARDHGATEGAARGAADRDRGRHERPRTGRHEWPAQAVALHERRRQRARLLDGRVPRVRSRRPASARCTTASAEPTCPWLTLEDVVRRDSASLKRSIAQARLVVVHNREIDNAGEGGVGPAVFDQVMQKLRAAWHLLRDAGVRRFVFTSDHGFLLLDESAPGPATTRASYRSETPARVLAGGRGPPGEVRVALSSSATTAWTAT